MTEPTDAEYPIRTAAYRLLITHAANTFTNDPQAAAIYSRTLDATMADGTCATPSPISPGSRSTATSPARLVTCKPRSRLSSASYASPRTWQASTTSSETGVRARVPR